MLLADRWVHTSSSASGWLVSWCMVERSNTRHTAPFFTVVICTWNRGHLLPRAFNSLLAQTDSAWEVVVVNDGSTDDTSQVLQKYMPLFPSMQCATSTSKSGTAAARNKGITMANGQYVTFLDSDDEYLPTHLELRRRRLLEDPSIELLHGGVTVVGDPYVIDKDNADTKIHISDCVVGGTFCIRSDVFTTVGMFDEQQQYADDAEFHQRVVNAGLHVAEIADPTYVYYRNVPGQLTSTGV